MPPAPYIRHMAPRWNHPDSTLLGILVSCPSTDGRRFHPLATLGHRVRQGHNRHWLPYLGTTRRCFRDTASIYFRERRVLSSFSSILLVGLTCIARFPAYLRSLRMDQCISASVYEPFPWAGLTYR